MCYKILKYMNRNAVIIAEIGPKKNGENTTTGFAT